MNAIHHERGPQASLAGVDLNLLVALAALLAERHVTRAAARIGITQSAMSHALARLRDLLGDPLLVRTPRGMLPTPRGAALVAPLERVLADIGRVLEPEAPFDPATVACEMSFASADYGEFVLLSPLVAYLTKHAPGIDLVVRPQSADVEAALESGDVDLYVGLKPDASPRVFVQRLFDERFVCVVREGHALVKSRRKLTLERFVELPHILISVRGTRGGTVDDALAERGLARRVVVRVPTFLVAPLLVSESDMILTLPERIARRFERVYGLHVLEPPIELKGFSIFQAWHERKNHDPAHIFFRRALEKSAVRPASTRTRSGTQKAAAQAE